MMVWNVNWIDWDDNMREDDDWAETWADAVAMFNRWIADERVAWCEVVAWCGDECRGVVLMFDNR